MQIFTSLLLVIAAGGFGAAAVYFLSKNKSSGDGVSKEVSVVDVSQEQVVLEAKAAAKEIILEAKDSALKVKTAVEEDVRLLREQANKLENEGVLKKAQTDAKEKELEEKAASLRKAKDLIEKKQSDVDELYRKQKEKLEQVSSLTREEARKLLMERFDKDLAEEKAKKLKEVEEEIKKTSKEVSQEILLDVLKFGATDYVVEHTTARVKLPDEDLKGRIIGKEGRNITAFEELTGVELDMDSTPGEVLVSSFDPIRREVAKLSLERLIADGRIQPARIEELVEKTQREVEHIIYKEGDDLCHKLGVYNLPKELVQILGRFKYRFSYGQNMTKHTLEVCRLGVAMAHELGVNVETVKLGCLLHDIGKVLSDEEGSHTQIGVDLLKKYNLFQGVIDCVGEHHEDKPFSSVESAVVALADHISGARPSARSEDYESYVKRMRELEDAALSFDGVDKAYAISAGREVRVFVSPSAVDDASTALLAREIARKIELEQTYPGVVKVTVIRETRVSETAK